MSDLDTLTRTVNLLSEHVLRVQSALLILAADESLPSATRAAMAAVLAGETT